jgi:hypothetical protein
MNWERKALEAIILSLAELDGKWGELIDNLGELGVHLDIIDEPIYALMNVLMDNDDCLIENQETYQEGIMTKEEYLELCLEFIEKKFSKK